MEYERGALYRMESTQNPLFKRLWWIWIIIIAIVAFVILTIIGNLNSHQFQDDNIKKQESINYDTVSPYPACPENLAGLFSYPLMLPEDYLFINPLGNLNPPNHVFPTDHMYFYFRQNNVGRPYERSVYAPGDMVLTSVEEIKQTQKNASSFRMNFIICDEIIVWISNMDNVSDQIRNDLKSVNAQCQNDPPTPAGTDVRCIYATDIQVKAGNLLGYIGGSFDNDEQAVDFGVYNNSESYSRNSLYDMHVLCPIDLYAEGDIKKVIYSRLGIYKYDKFILRTTEPRCGSAAQDIPGTIQGAWYEQVADVSAYKKDPRGKVEMLSLARENVDPAVSTISFGMDFPISGKISFMPESDGVMNRDFSEVTADGKIYCYQNQYIGNKSGFWHYIPGKAIVQLLDEHHLKIEQQDDACGGSESFKNPFSYER